MDQDLVAVCVEERFTRCVSLAHTLIVPLLMDSMLITDRKRQFDWAQDS